MHSVDFIYYLGMAGTVAFAATAVLAVIPKGIDLFGACVMGIITAIGGGTMRDVILNEPVFWANDLNYIWVALITSVITFYANRLVAQKYVYRLMLYLDAIGVSMFVIQGADKCIDLKFAMPVGPVFLGLLTAIGGGLIRDVLAGSPTLLMKKELYAVPLTLGVVLYLVLFTFFPDQQVGIAFGCVTLAFLIRASAIYWDLQVPDWMRLKEPA
ncbi:trimeric intracellular cation channel family protein [Pontibacter sp. G13]|uniref:trimeric intracellular cation channel family protein n=1 Tax=Pontibacter sp. G13 TaxID=3074898 RepID=UPI002889DD3A|nr:trimeric intracellular cation channel family protein [Pontibacter sp. G13]WNJ19160.1 trimeric intracellular cation channel family protein [Pontibacter sp. G13]